MYKNLTQKQIDYLEYLVWGFENLKSDVDFGISHKQVEWSVNEIKGILKEGRYLILQSDHLNSLRKQYILMGRTEQNVK